MADLDRIREALSFGARTGDPELMAAIYQLEPEGPEIEIDDGPKVIPRTCSLCGVTYLVSQRHAENVPAESQFNTCQKCIDKMIGQPENAPMSPAEAKFVEAMMKEIRGDDPMGD